MSSPYLKIEGSLSTADGKYYAGGFTRYVDLANKHAHQEVLVLEKDFQGSGLGTNLFEKNIEAYRKLGIKDVSLMANGTVGSYAWATLGFDFEDKSTMSSIKKGFKSYVTRMFAKKNESVPSNVVAGLSKIKHSWDLARFTIDGDKVGKEYLLKGHAWSGRMKLGDRESELVYGTGIKHSHEKQALKK